MNTYAVIGYGGRGSLYTRLLNERGDFTLTAVCDINPDKLDKAVRDTGISKDKTFVDPEKFSQPESWRTRLFCPPWTGLITNTPYARLI